MKTTKTTKMRRKTLKTLKTMKKTKILSYMIVILLNTMIFEKLISCKSANECNKITHSSIKKIIVNILEKLKYHKAICNSISLSSTEITKLSKKLFPIVKLFEVLYNDNNEGDKYSKIKSGGGAYLGHIIDKGDKPITGNDFKKAVDDISQILSSVMFAPALTERFGVFGVTTLMDIFQGNDEAFKEYFKWHLSDEYLDIYPPSLKMDKITELLPSLQNYINVYFTHEHIKNQAAVDEGKLGQAALNPSALEQLSEKIFSTEMDMQMALFNPTSLGKGFNPTLFIKGKV